MTRPGTFHRPGRGRREPLQLNPCPLRALSRGRKRCARGGRARSGTRRRPGAPLLWWEGRWRTPPSAPTPLTGAPFCVSAASGGCVHSPPRRRHSSYTQPGTASAARFSLSLSSRTSPPSTRHTGMCWARPQSPTGAACSRPCAVAGCASTWRSLVFKRTSPWRCRRLLRARCSRGSCGCLQRPLSSGRTRSSSSASPPSCAHPPPSRWQTRTSWTNPLSCVCARAVSRAVSSARCCQSPRCSPPPPVLPTWRRLCAAGGPFGTPRGRGRRVSARRARTSWALSGRCRATTSACRRQHLLPQPGSARRWRRRVSRHHRGCSILPSATARGARRPPTRKVGMEAIWALGDWAIGSTTPSKHYIDAAVRADEHSNFFFGFRAMRRET